MKSMLTSINDWTSYSQADISGWLKVDARVQNKAV